MIASLALAVELAPMTEPRSPIEDVVLTSSAQDANGGRDLVIATGPGRVLLVRHAGLHLTTMAGRRITSARLVFTVVDGAPKVKDVRRMTKGWTEGTGWVGEQGPANGATWKNAQSGKDAVRWEAPGAAGSTDAVAAPGWTSRQEGDKLIIEGLGEAAQAMAAGPLDNQGLRIEFEGDGRLRSAEDPAAGPRFEVEAETAPTGPQNLRVLHIEPAAGQGLEPTEWEAVVENAGSETATGATLSWIHGTTEVNSIPLPPLPAGASARVSRSFPWRPATDSPWTTQIGVQLTGGGARMSSFFVQPWGLPVAASAGTEDAVRAAVQHFNAVVAPFSRFGFAQGGVAERLRYVSSPAKADVVAGPEASQGLAQAIQSILAKAVRWEGPPLRSGYGLSPDTRDDRFEFPGVPITTLGWASRQTAAPPLIESGLLGKYEAGALHQLVGVRGAARAEWRPVLPNALVLRCFDGSARPLNDMPVSIYRGSPDSQLLVRTRTISSGGLFLTPAGFEPAEKTLLPAGAGPGDRLVLVFGRTNGPTQRVDIPWRQLVEEGLRGPSPTASIELRVQLPLGAIDREADSALGRPVEDSLGRFPAELAALVDGRPETSVSFPPASPASPQYFEIDLGRERMVGEIEITFDGEPWEAFEVLYYGTAQPATSAQPWLRVSSSAFVEGVEGSRVVLRGASTLMRYVRVAPLRGGAAKVSGVVIRSLAQAASPPAPLAR